MGQIRITTVAIALVVTLSILLGGYFLYDKYYLKKGLEERIGQVVVVEEIKIAKKEKPPTVYIRSSEINDLQSIYQEITEEVFQTLGSDYRVVILDERTEQLSKSYEHLSFIIQEGIATGGFQEMSTRVQEYAMAQDIQCHLTMDSFNLFLELKEDQGYLYEVIPRLSGTGEKEKLGSESR